MPDNLNMMEKPDVDLIEGLFHQSQLIKKQHQGTQDQQSAL